MGRMKTKINLICKSKHLILCVLVLIFLSSCASPTAPNIKSVDDLKGRKLLVGRFIFYVNGKLIEPHEVVEVEYDELDNDTDASRRKEKKTDTENEKYTYLFINLHFNNISECTGLKKNLQYSRLLLTV